MEVNQATHEKCLSEFNLHMSSKISQNEDHFIDIKSTSKKILKTNHLTESYT